MCSKSPEVAKAVAERRKMKSMLEQNERMQDDVRETSKYPEYIVLYDKGGKIYVTARVLY